MENESEVTGYKVSLFGKNCSGGGGRVRRGGEGRGGAGKDGVGEGETNRP